MGLVTGVEVGADVESGSSLGDEPVDRSIIVPSTACLWVFIFYLAGGTIMFAEWERWSYLDACYFCVTSLCKIGPLQAEIRDGNQWRSRILVLAG